MQPRSKPLGILGILVVMAVLLACTGTESPSDVVLDAVGETTAEEDESDLRTRMWLAEYRSESWQLLLGEDEGEAAPHQVAPFTAEELVLLSMAGSGLRTSDAGASWTPDETIQLPLGGYVADTMGDWLGIAGADGSVRTSTDGGLTLTQADIPESGITFMDIDRDGSGPVWVAGFMGTEGRLVRIRQAGADAIVGLPGGMLVGVDGGKGEDTVAVVDSDGMVAVTQDGGATWASRDYVGEGVFGQVWSIAVAMIEGQEQVVVAGQGADGAAKAVMAHLSLDEIGVELDFSMLDMLGAPAAPTTVVEVEDYTTGGDEDWVTFALDNGVVAALTDTEEGREPATVGTEAADGIVLDVGHFDAGSDAGAPGVAILVRDAEGNVLFGGVVHQPPE